LQEAHKIELFDNKGVCVGTWTAYNNIDSAYAKANYKSLTHLKDGTYHFHDKHKPNQKPLTLMALTVSME
jgi:hypothetical protein